MQRIVDQELLDEDKGTSQEIEASLRSIAHANRRFGGDRLHARLLACALARVPPGQRPHILEIGSGRAEVLRNALLLLQISAEITLLDRVASHLPDPQTWPTELRPRIIVGDGLSLPFADASADIVSCCLLLHHLEPPEIMRFLDEALRVARVAIVINDLERTGIHHRLAQLRSRFDPSRISVHDGPASVRRAYTYREFEHMLANTGRSFALERAYLFRLGAVVWCR